MSALHPTAMKPEPDVESINLGLTWLEKILDGNHPAIIDCGNGQERVFTFDDLDRLANDRVAFLKEQGLNVGDRIALVAPNSAEFLVSLYAIYRIGGVAVPLNYKMPVADIHHILEDSESKFVFCDSEYLHVIPSTIPSVDICKNIPPADKYHPPVPAFTLKEGLIIYTSGSTGKPKGVILAHQKHLWSILRWRKDRWKLGKNCLISAPWYHMNGLATIQGSIASRSVCLILPEFDASRYLELIPKHKVIIIYSVTPMLAMLCQHEKIETTDLSSIRFILTGSSPLSQKLIDTLKQHMPNAAIFNSYGLTETGPRVFGPHPEGKQKPIISVGYPVPGIDVRIVDNILQVRSPGMMIGYNKRQDLVDKAVTEDGYFITNDLFRVDEEGFYYFEGRADDMFKSGGHKVYPSRIEELLESHPGVANAVVIGVDDDIKGKKPYAFVIRKNGSNVTEQELKTHVLDNAAAYMHPREVWFLDQFPLSGTNKIDKKALLAVAIQNLDK